jgi:hypothetical protein
MANKYMQKCSMPLGIKEVQMKIHYNFTSLQPECLSSRKQQKLESMHTIKEHLHTFGGNVN